LGDGTNTFDVRFKGPNNWAVQLDTPADNFTVQRNSVGFVTINGAGRVGIGTTSPATSLHLLGDNTPTRGQLSITGNNADARITLYPHNSFVGNIYANTTNGITIAAETGYSISFAPGGTSEKARFDTSGRLLVGTSTSPTVGDTQYGRIRTVGNTSSSASFGVISIGRGEAASSITTEEEIGYLTFTDSAGGAFAHIECRADGAANTGDYPGRLVFSTTADGASNPTERMKIDSSGNINIDSGTVYVDAVNNRFGIGTQSPLAKLHVKVGTNENLWVGSLGGSGTGVYIGAVNDSTSLNVPLQIGNSSITTFATQGVERARIDSSGNLLVGTTSNDHGVKLVVSNSSGYGSAAYIGNVWIGQVINSINNNSELILLHRLGQGQGFQFSGDCIINSWTGSAFISMIVTTYFITDAVQWSVSQATSTISKTTIQLVTATYNSQSWLCFLKAGGGTGVAYFNALVESNAHLHGGIRAVTSGYTVTTTHATLN
jgi:hypothetical protein